MKRLLNFILWFLPTFDSCYVIYNTEDDIIQTDAKTLEEVEVAAVSYKKKNYGYYSGIVWFGFTAGRLAWYGEVEDH